MAFGYREATAEEQAIIPGQPPIIAGPESLTDEQRKYINSYLITKSLAKASQVTKINRFYHHRWMDNEVYAALIYQVRAYIRGEKAEMIENRVGSGWLEPLVYKGRRTGQRMRRFSDVLDIAWMKAHYPEWRDGSQVAVGPVKISIEMAGPAGAEADPQTITISAPDTDPAK